MQTKRLEEAIFEAKRFLNKAEELIASGAVGPTYVSDKPVEQGAVMRSSMDLSRALSQLRNDRGYA